MSITKSCVEGCSLPSTPNDIKILLKQIKREIKELATTTEAKLLCHDGKIAEMCKYIKNNLSNTIRCLLDSMLESGELDTIIIEALNDEIDLLKRLFATPEDFGAKGDGITDDTLAIQNAINSANNVYFHPGTYKVSSEIKLKSNLIIMGQNAKIISPLPKIFVGDGIENVIISNINLESTVDTSNTYNMSESEIDFRGYTLLNAIINITNSNNIKVKECNVKGSFTGINIGTSKNVLVENNDVSQASHICVCLSKSEFVCKENYVHDVKTFDNGKSYPTYLIQATDDEETAHQEYSIIDNNKLVNNPMWDAIMSHRFTKLKITNNTIKNVRNGIDLTSVKSEYEYSELIISDNIIVGTSTNKWNTDALNQGIILLSTDETLIKRVNIINNVIKNFGIFPSPSGASLIHIQNVDSINISANSLYFEGANNGDYQGCIMIKGNVDNVVIDSNIIKSNIFGILLNNPICENVSINNNIANGTHNIFIRMYAKTKANNLEIKNNNIGSIEILDYINSGAVINGVTFTQDASNSFFAKKRMKIRHSDNERTIEANSQVAFYVPAPNLKLESMFDVEALTLNLPDGLILQAKYSDSQHVKVVVYNIKSESITLPALNYLIKIEE